MAITISQAIVHEIPKGAHSSKDDSEVTLSTQLTPLQAETRRFIVDNILNVALKEPRDIKEDPDATSQTPGLVSAIFKNADKTFVEASQEIAQVLYRSQTATSPSGILVVATIKQDAQDKVLLMKAEHQEGMRLRHDESTGRLDLEHLNELIVGHNSKIYKVALLNLSDEESLVGVMVDRQNGVAYADFFLTKFLGCTLADRSEVQTKIFMESSMKHFNDIEDPVKAARYASALTSYMQTPSKDFQSSVFADTYLDVEDRDHYLDSIPHTVGDSVIRKDLKLISGGGHGVKFIGQGFTLVASQESLAAGNIRVTKSEDGSTVIKLNGQLKQIGFGSVPKSSQ
ncbi:nucleoid-associated protein [Glutamicibacter sp. 2E12]|uniref:nucleoid-associated protein n=1 Tax=Glutamicibacter sp. 2E12 TaxID=3416181 RepID=UPI003CE982D9